MKLSSNDEHHESIPLGQGDGSVEFSERDGKNGYKFSKAKIITAIVIFILLVIVVIVLAVLVGIFAPREKEKLPPSQNVTISPTSEPTTVEPTTAGTERWWNPRLPTNVIPKHYDLFLNITVDLPTFEGDVEIEVDVKEATDLIIVHENGLRMHQVNISSKGTKDIIPIKNHFPFKKYNYYVIQMVESLKPGLYVMQMSFVAVFMPWSLGLYKDTYTRPSGEIVNFTATQFEDHEARRAFPCFDEPAMKATFNVTIAHRPDYVALSNMPVYKTETMGRQKVDYFMQSVLMPTYLLAFVVGDFVSVEAISKNNITMRYFSRPSSGSNLNYSVSIGGRMMTYLEELFDVKYPLPKEDMAGIPNFRYGGMENWGLIIYREKFLVWDPRQSTEIAKFMVAQVMAHELVHMWFGNIVTLNWWNDIWLNEGFAKFFEYRVISFVEPDWKNQDDQIFGMKGAMSQDLFPYSNPLSEDARTTLGTSSMISSIYYDKGMCIIRMLASFLGEKTFMDGLKIYLKRHAYSNVVTDDLWKVLHEASCSSGQCMDIKQIMDPWTLQTGFPLVTFKKKNATHYTVSQTQSKSPNGTYKNSKFGYSWVIPFSYAIKDKGTKFTWMNMTSATIEWDGKGWIKANTDHNGYYVTKYDQRNWLALADQLKQNHTVFSLSDRAGLIFDLYQSGDNFTYSTLFTVVEYLVNETEYIPWKLFFDVVNRLLVYLPKSSAAHKYLLKYLVFLGKKQYERLGFHDTGTAVDKVARGYFLDLFCKANDKTCTAKAYQMFKAWMKDPTKNTIPPNLRKVVFFYGVALGGVDEWDFLYRQLKTSKDEENLKIILYGLAGSREPWIIERYLSYVLDLTKLTKYQYLVFKYICTSNPYGKDIAWGFVRAHWQGKKKELLYLVDIVTQHFHTEYRLKEVQSMGRSTKRIKKKMKWLEQKEKKIEQVLEGLLVKNNVLLRS